MLKTLLNRLRPPRPTAPVPWPITRIENMCRHEALVAYNYGGEVPGGVGCSDCGADLCPRCLLPWWTGSAHGRGFCIARNENEAPK